MPHEQQPARAASDRPERGRAFRVIRGGVLATLALLAVVSAIVLGLLGGDHDRVDQTTAQAISGGVSSIAQSVASVLGQVEVEPERRAWHGLRLYLPQQDQWRRVGPDEQWDKTTATVLLIHGLDEPGGIWDQLAPALGQAGMRVLRFDYPNDQAIVRSSDALDGALDSLHTIGIDRLDIVAHSMGGLVARESLTRPGYADRGLEVERLVTLGTPHKGSPWARLRAVAEIREQVQRWAESDDLDPRRLLGFVDDGVGQAGEDLLPGSAFLTQLDSKAMPESVRVICVVARTDAPQNDATKLGSHAATQALVDLLGAQQAQSILDEVDRLGRELGDGVVPMSSAAMDGADRVVVVHANHRSMIRNIELGQALRRAQGLPDPPEPPAISVVLEALGEE